MSVSQPIERFAPGPPDGRQPPRLRAAPKPAPLRAPGVRRRRRPSPRARRPRGDGEGRARQSRDRGVPERRGDRGEAARGAQRETDGERRSGAGRFTTTVVRGR